MARASFISFVKALDNSVYFTMLVALVLSCLPILNWFTYALVAFYAFKREFKNTALIILTIFIGDIIGQLVWVNFIDNTNNFSLNLLQAISYIFPVILLAIALKISTNLSKTLPIYCLLLGTYVVLMSTLGNLPTPSAISNYVECLLGCSANYKPGAFMQSIVNFTAKSWVAWVFLMNAFMIFLAQKLRLLIDKASNQIKKNSFVNFRLGRISLGLATLFALPIFLDNAYLWLEVNARLALALLALSGLAFWQWFFNNKQKGTFWIILFYLFVLTGSFLSLTVLIGAVFLDYFLDLRTNMFKRA